MTLTAPANAREIVSAAEVAAGYDRLAAELQPLIVAGDCLLLAILTGGYYPLAQLTQRLQGDYLLDYCHATRYGDQLTGAALVWERPVPASADGRHVLLIDDIYDEGITLHAVADACRDAGATAVSTVIQVVKDRPRSPGRPVPDFTTGISVPDCYVFGCGMDVRGHWRHLPAIYALDESAEDAA